MRKLNSPFKKLSVANPFNFPVFLFFMVPAVLVSCSSRTPVSVESAEAPRVVNDHVSLITVSGPIRESWVEIRSSAMPQAMSPIRISAKSCLEQKFVFGASLVVLGQTYDINFEEEGGQIGLALVEDSETKLSGFEIATETKNSICSQSGDFRQGFIGIDNTLHSSLMNSISKAMVKLAPDCKSITFDAASAKCQLDAMMPQTALVKTEEFQKAMIRKWSRQPYILARRTGVVSTLAKTATNLANDDNFAKFCRILQFSLPEELPVVMTSRRWQSALCSGQDKLRREAAYYGLAKGSQELAMLRELYEGTSRVGVLSVKIPLQAIPGHAEDASRQPLRVTIAPEDDVTTKLVDEAKKYLGRSDRDEAPKRLVRVKRNGKVKKFFETVAETKPKPSAPEVARVDMCWHPVFGESWGLLRIADGMKLTGEGFDLECGYTYERTGAAEKELASLSKYLLQSLSSETEFVLDNGQSKLLRLPEGNYRYTVHVLPANPLDSDEVDDENVPKTAGELGWGSARNHAIKTW